MRNCALLFHFSFFPTVSGKYYVLSGQHRVEAARRVAQEAASTARVVPPWTQQFRCRIVKAEATLEQRQMVAGRTQAKDSTVLDMAASERVAWLVYEMKKDKERHEQEQKKRQDEGREVEEYIPNKQLALRETYLKTGCKERSDGSMVCTCALFMEVRAVLRVTNSL